jgi:hypothetical protein
MGAMSRTLLNFWLDVILLVTFVALLWNAFVLGVLFPSGANAGGWNLWGWGYDHWAAMQFKLTCLLALEVLLHVMLHWSWVCGVLTGRILRPFLRSKATWDDGVQTLVGVGFLACLLIAGGVLFAAAAVMIRPPA